MPQAASPADRQAPDPVIGAGLTLLGIFVMGVGGSNDLHWVFDTGVLLAVIGAVTFVLFVALSAMRSADAAGASTERDEGTATRTSSPDAK